MENKIYLWYNEMLGEYSYGSQEELSQIFSYYAERNITILYEMKSSKLSLCKRIIDSLNQVGAGVV